MRRALLLLALAGLLEQPSPLVERGRAAYAVGRYADAAADFRRAARELGRPEAAFDLGAALYQEALGRPDPERVALLAEAATAYAAARLVPALRLDAAYSLGNVRLQQGSVDEAVALYQTVLRADPGDADARTNLEIALARRRPADSDGDGPPGTGGSGENPDGAPPDPQGDAPRPDGGEAPAAAGAGELDWKLDALERRSADLLHERLRAGGEHERRLHPGRDW